MMMSHSALGAYVYCVCSFYIGRRPMVMVADLDMVKQITVVEFGHFMDREVSSTGGVGDTPLHVFSRKGFKPQVDQELICTAKEHLIPLHKLAQTAL